jgi:hypothetical protein
LLFERFDSVRIGAMLEQKLHGLHVTRARRGHQRRLALARCALNVRTMLEQHPQHRGITAAARLQQRRDAEAVRDIRIRARIQQELSELDRRLISRPEQRRRAVAFGRIDVGTGIQLRAHAAQVVVAGRGRDSRRSRVQGGKADENRDHQKRGAAANVVAHEAPSARYGCSVRSTSE